MVTWIVMVWQLWPRLVTAGLGLVRRQMPTLAALHAPSICCAPVGCSLILAGDLVFLHA